MWFSDFVSRIKNIGLRVCLSVHESVRTGTRLPRDLEEVRRTGERSERIEIGSDEEIDGNISRINERSQHHTPRRDQ